MLGIIPLSMQKRKAPLRILNERLKDIGVKLHDNLGKSIPGRETTGPKARMWAV